LEEKNRQAIEDKQLLLKLLSEKINVNNNGSGIINDPIDKDPMTRLKLIQNDLLIGGQKFISKEFDIHEVIESRTKEIVEVKTKLMMEEFEKKT